MSDAGSTTLWVTVAEAADKAQVDSGTVRQWYRSGRIPTRRAEGERGAFLVPLDLVLSLVDPRDEPVTAPSAPSIEDAQRGVFPDPSPAAEIDALQTELAQVRDQLEFLRSQLAEVTDENRTLQHQLQLAQDQRADLRAELADAVDDRKGVEVRLHTVEAELTQLRRTAARSSITDSSWLDLETPAYESPVRRQAMAAEPGVARESSPLGGGPTGPFSEERGSDLAGLLASTRPGGGSVGPDPSSRSSADLSHDREEHEASRAIWTDEAPHPPLGESPDDLLPEPEKKGRFGKR